MIVAIEGLIPDRRLSPSMTQPTPPPVEPQFYKAKWLREQEQQPVAEEPGDPVAGTKTPPAAPQVPHPEPALEPSAARANHTSSPNLDLPQPSLANPFINPKSLNWVSRRNRLRLRRRSGQSRLPQTALFPKQTLLWAAPLNSIKDQILSNFTKYPAPSTRGARRKQPGDNNR
jgi:hypothetical protein